MYENFKVTHRHRCIDLSSFFVVAQIDSRDDARASALPHSNRVARFSITKIARDVGVVVASLLAGVLLAMGWTAYRHAEPSAQSLVVASLAKDASTAPTAFDDDEASSDMRTLAHWIAVSANNTGLAYLIVDKRAAIVYVFSPEGTFMARPPIIFNYHWRAS